MRILPGRDELISQSHSFLQTNMELGISSFGEISPDGVAGKAVNAHQRMQQLLEEIKLADEVGLDVFALGEHHRPDFVVSAPEVILAAAATITKNIKLSSSVTVLSSADPVRVFQNFASLDLISNGRAEIMRVGVRLSNRFRCLGMTCPTTTNCSPKSWIYW